MAREPLAVTLNTMHNVTHYERLMQDLRCAIAAGTLTALVDATGVEAEKEHACQG